MNIKKSNLIQILEYSLLAFGIPLLCIFLCRLTRIKENGALSLILYGIEGASPTLAVIILIFVQNNKSGLIKYLHKKYIWNFDWKKCILALFIPFILLTCAKLVAMIFGDTNVFLSPITVRKILIISWALIAEELGWRGFLQDKLETLISDKYIPLIVGVIWALWHYHFILLGSMEVPVFAFAAGCIFESYGYFAITKFAKNNIVPACIWHFTGNMMFNLYRFDPQWHLGSSKFYWIATAFYSVFVVIFFAYGKKK